VYRVRVSTFTEAENQIPEDFAKDIARFVIDASLTIGLPPERLEKLVVADEPNFGTAVQEIGHETYTKTETGNIVMAKMSSRFGCDGEVNCSIAVLIDTLSGIARGLETGKEFPEWEPFDLLCYYTIYHELGHCLDLARRKDLKNVPLRPDPRRLELSQYALYHGRIVREEFAASYFAAGWMGPGAYRLTEDIFISDLADRKAKMAAARAAAAIGQTPKVLAIDLQAQLVWYLLSQYAKLAATKLGHPRLPHRPPEEVFKDETQKAVFEQFERALADYWEQYPAWHFRPPAIFEESWRGLAHACGFQL
jgi:hypothetical protein